MSKNKVTGPSAQTIQNQIKAGQKRSALIQSEALKAEYKDLGPVAYWAKYNKEMK